MQNLHEGECKEIQSNKKNIRTIKFRLWDAEDGVMFYSEPHDFVQLKADRPDKRYGVVMRGNLSVAAKIYPLMQFTGLRDRNGKEIYEGDVLKRKADRRAYRVAIDVAGIRPWHTDCLLPNERGRTCAFDFYPLEGGYKATKWEIIGNVHENPDLLQPEGE